MAWKAKYDQRVDDLRTRLDVEIASSHDFIFGPPTWRASLSSALRDDWLLPTLLRFARTFMPVFSFAGLRFVTRATNVREAFERSGDFRVPFGPEMRDLSGVGATAGEEVVTFALGVDLSDEEGEHGRQRELLETLLRPEDHETVLEDVRCVARGLLEDSGGRIDAMKDYFIPILTEVCLTYYGLECDEPEEFAKWAMAASAMLFADPYGEEDTRRAGLAGAKRLNAVIDRSWNNWKKRAARDPSNPQLDKTLLGRMAILEGPHQKLRGDIDCAKTDGRVRSLMLGLITGFVPTTALAAGHALAALRRQGQFGRLADAARGFNGNATSLEARKQDAHRREQVAKIILEAARLKPAGYPGHLRRARQTTSLQNAHAFSWLRGWPFAAGPTVQKDATLMVSTASALMDENLVGEAPHKFQPDRSFEPNLMFGHGDHSCVGRELATKVMTEAYAMLFARPEIRPAAGWFTRMKRLGTFPYSFPMAFAPELAVEGLKVAPRLQSMITIAIPVPQDKKEKLFDTLETLGNPAKPSPDRSPGDQPANLADCLQDTQIVHFASMVVAEVAKRDGPRAMLIIEIAADGEPRDVLKKIEAKAASQLSPILELTGMPASSRPAEWLGQSKHLLNVRQRPWGTTGLNFNGADEFPAHQIEQERELFKYVKDEIERFIDSHRGEGNFSLGALRFVRKRIRANRPDLKHLLFRPGSVTLRLSTWNERSAGEAVATFLRSSPHAWTVYLLFAAVGVAAGLVAGLAADSFLGGSLVGVLAGLTAILLTSALALALVGAAALVLRWHESRDMTDDTDPKFSHVIALEALENHPGYQQNHVTAVTELKKGWFRRLALATGFFGIAQVIKYRFRHGFIADIGTIHQAKWFRIPNSDTMVFQANYDGSWESYLEDFANKAYQGQNAAWSHCVGFPKTRFMTLDGARDGDRFKRWVRRKQVKVPFWYSRFPDMTNDQVRINALVRDGLARARTDTDARAWLSYFGSMPRPGDTIESEEVQTIVFRGMASLTSAACLALTFKDEKDVAEAKLKQFVGFLLGRSNPHAPMGATSAAGHIAFGDVKHLKRACSIAFSAEGLKRLGVPSEEEQDGLGSFPVAFVAGMGQRGTILGDGESAQDWDWADLVKTAGAEPGSKPDKVTHAVLIVMARDSQSLKTYLCELRPEIDQVAKQVHEVVCAYVGGDAKKEHFGFRDGISQPVMRGTDEFAKGVLAHDAAAAGEFILGYPDNAKTFAPSPFLWATRDPKGELPSPPDRTPGRFANFSPETPCDRRDFGRNGTFLVIRQLEQDVDAFWQAMEDHAAEINENANGSVMPISAEWLAAKMMGRWKNGVPLVRQPEMGRTAREERELQHDSTVNRSREAEDEGKPEPGSTNLADENDFLFGRDDPQGFRCPHGAHIRRANPRDSFAPGSAQQVEISNRHRILRRGRAYEQGDKRGLLFMCLNANIERQFEFIQQTWTNSRSFHGLRMEPDPLLLTAAGRHQNKVGQMLQYTIPTPNGPYVLNGLGSYVTMRGGGYFFLPGKATLRYMSLVPAHHGVQSDRDMSGKLEVAQA
ncbi:MAG: hypothetical protein K5872_03995 [Rhizobiaceae bacterium]|nr:hypothetical protein [Rhizobiaceae bacterium]MCV0405373.1 hypothetical protein [Rhizobiaceae bacterium]